MLKKITIRGFQSIRNPVEIELEGYTAIYGPSNIGKSAALRAHAALWTNRKGNGFVSQDCGEAVVREDFDDGSYVQWSKSAKSTSYEINGKSYDKSGKLVPEELEKFGFLPVTTGKGNYWVQYQNQMASPFILGDSSAVTAGELLAASQDRFTVTAATRLAKKDLSMVEREISQREEESHSQRTFLEKTAPFLESLEKAAQETQLLQKKISEKEQRISILGNFLESRGTSLQKLGYCSGAEEYEEIRTPDSSRLELLECLGKERSRINRALHFLVGVEEVKNLVPDSPEKIETLYALIDQRNQNLKNLASFEKLSFSTPVIPENESLVRFQRMVEEKESHETELGGIDLEITGIDSLLQKRLEEEKEVLEALGRCPICDRDLTREDSRRHEEGFGKCQTPTF